MENKGLDNKKIVNLPTYPNAFIGRNHHIQFISKLLKEENRRLLTLLGPGGIGKTRLSVKVGEHLADHFQHGVCFVALDSVTDHKQVPLYVGHRLGLKANFTGDWIETVINYLSDKHFLLILDNLEQLLPFARQIDRMLDACPGLKVLVTSREVLGLPREIEYPLDSLNRPNPRLFPSPEDLIKFDAIDLFVQKAKASRPDFQLDEENAAAVVKICQELDGLPLPIELAAARIKLFSPKIILQKLSSRYDLLKNRSAGVAERHQNIRNTVQWSYDLLEGEEQQLFRQLSLFRGGFTLEALEATCPGTDALEVIESFINKSLIIKDQEIEGIPRFRMLKLIRDYGLERLAGQPDRQEYDQRFADYFLTFLQRGDTQNHIAKPARWMALVEAEYENLEAALEWLMVHRPKDAVRLGTIFWRFHLSRGFLREGLQMIEKLLSLSAVEQHLEAKLLEGAGTLSHNLGDHTHAREYFARCLEIWENICAEAEIIKALNNMAWAAWRTGDYDQTIAHSEKALKLSRRINDALGQAKSLNNIAWTHFHRGDFERVEELQRQVLAIHTSVIDPKGIAFARTNLGRALIRCGKFMEAEQMINAGIEVFNNLKNQQLLAFSRSVRAELYFEIGDLPAADCLFREYCLPAFEQIGDVWGIGQCHLWLGRIARHEQQDEAVGFHLNLSLEYFRNSRDKFGQATAGFWWSLYCRERGEIDPAAAALDQSLMLAAEMKVSHLLARGHLEQGRVAIRENRPDVAIQYLAVADHYAAVLGNYRYEQFKQDLIPMLEPIRPRLASGEVDLVKVFADDCWRIPERYIADALDRTHLRERLREMLRSKSSGPVTGVEKSGKITTRKADPTPEVDPFVKQVRKVIESHLSDPVFSVKDLCREMNMSHSQLHRRLSAHTGHSTSHFIRHLRIERAKTMLKDPQLTIASVAYDTGFRDTDYFHRVFKQVTGMTPGAFRGR